MTATPTAFYQQQNGLYVPTGLGVSPWNGQSQNGVAVAGLAAHVLDQAPSPTQMLTARLTIDIQGAVPMIPLEGRVRPLREGRRLQLLEVELVAEDRVWLRATALRVRVLESPSITNPVSRSLPEPDEIEAAKQQRWVDSIRREGDFLQPGPGAQWVRFRADVVEGHPLSPLEAVAMLADFGSGAAPLLSVDEWSLANVDISVHLTRLPASEWLLIDAASESAGLGVGLTNSRIGDSQGMFAMAHQTIFVQPGQGIPTHKRKWAEVESS